MKLHTAFVLAATAWAITTAPAAAGPADPDCHGRIPGMSACRVIYGGGAIIRYPEYAAACLSDLRGANACEPMRRAIRPVVFPASSAQCGARPATTDGC